MTTRYPGGLIRKTPPTITPPVGGEGGSAPGVWTLEQASYYTKQGTWPLPILPKYLYGMGANGRGQLGLNNIVYRSSPTQVGTDSNWSSIASASRQFVGVKSTGIILACGFNYGGGLGQNDRIDRSSPTQIGALTNWSLVSTGFYYNGAIKTDGTLWMWGYNVYGELGLNDIVSRSSPVQVGSGTSWSYIACGIFATAAIKTDGTLWTWGAGQGSNAILAQNDNIARSSPVQVGALTTWLTAYLGQYSGVATRNDGTIWAWGRNTAGQLGDGTVVNRSSPVQIGALTNWTLVKTNGYNHSAARRNDGTLWLWGNGNYGALGQNNTTSYSSPVQLGTETNWSSQFVPLYSGGNLAIKTDGTLWAWGLNSSGRLGLNDVVSRSSPVQVGSDTTWTKISEGAVAYSPMLIKST